MAWLVTELRENALAATVVRVEPVWVFRSKLKTAGLPAMFGTAVSLFALSLIVRRAGAAANGVVDAKPVIWFDDKSRVVKAVIDEISLTVAILLLVKVNVWRLAESGDRAEKTLDVSMMLFDERSKVCKAVKPVNQDEDKLNSWLLLKVRLVSLFKEAKPVAIPFILVGVIAELIMLNDVKLAAIGVKAPDVMVDRVLSDKDSPVIETAPVKTLSPIVVRPFPCEMTLLIVRPLK
jgi:hypothetical protein